MPSDDVWRLWHALQAVRALLSHFPTHPDWLARERYLADAYDRALTADAAVTLSPTA